MSHSEQYDKDESNLLSSHSLSWWEIWKRLIEISHVYGPKLVQSMWLLVLAALLQGGALACIMPLFVAVFTTQDAQLVFFWLGVMTVLMLLSSAARWGAQGFDFRGDMAQNTHQLRTRLGEKLRIVPLETLKDKRAGEVNATLLGNVDENMAYTLTIANMLLNALLCPFVVAVFTLYYDWRLGLLLMLIFPTLIPLYRWLAPRFSRGVDNYVAAHQQMNANILEYTQGIQVMRATGCVGEKAERLQESLAYLEKVQVEGQEKGTKPNLLISSVFELGMLFVFGCGAYLVTKGETDLAVLAALLVVIVRYAEPLSSFIGYTKIIHLVEASLVRIETLLKVTGLPQLPPQEPQSYDIEFEKVDFSYQGSKHSDLKEFDLKIPARSMTALVGPSGAGKTTVTRLLMRYADPQNGCVKIGGVDVRAIPAESINHLISVVFQDVYLFDDTILANIRMARPEASELEVQQAAIAANCHDFIRSLPQGYHTRVGDIGSRLSGGERQRISIARAILKNAPILILDEPTAALDTESEVAVQAAIDHLIKDKTVIVVAHRLSTITSASNIVVVDQGMLAEQGTHHELLRKRGRYSVMWQAQQRVKHWHLAEGA
ncbi:ABC transporter ATP-binding protein [Photobacterium atrarenae]|uniref:ABC transporter ATP-binding protein/permease n=1 Tax=Photobacterium atrarenae TaxID=865757 RepID=A0ABY5GKX6_9GAMM|nr:ABC transporter ATP-binding protein [Photobacterium atrarenae]UTV29806.1 ABC transporter ATP-binding protein/permease [Photobacterium atrarenae]